MMSRNSLTNCQTCKTFSFLSLTSDENECKGAENGGNKLELAYENLKRSRSHRIEEIIFGLPECGTMAIFPTDYGLRAHS